MKSKSSSVENSKNAPNRKKRAPSRNGIGNGKAAHGNGHGNGDGDAVQNDIFDGQPPITQLLARGGRNPSRELDKAKLLTALAALKKGDFSARLPMDLEGIEGKIADTFNDVVELNQRMADELERLSRVVGKEGKIGQRADIGEVSGAWKDSVKCVNNLISDLVHPINETGRVIGAVAKGDLSQSMAMEIDGRPLAGEFLRTAKIVNTMVDQLSSFASEVTRVAREVGTEGKLGGQAKVKGVAGTW
jgi:methyl-accepting chemotaxis protein